MFSTSTLLVVLLCVSSSFAATQWALDAYYSNAACTGSPVGYQFYPDETCTVSQNCPTSRVKTLTCTATFDPLTAVSGDIAYYTFFPAAGCAANTYTYGEIYPLNVCYNAINSSSSFLYNSLGRVTYQTSSDCSGNGTQANEDLNACQPQTGEYLSLRFAVRNSTTPSTTGSANTTTTGSANTTTTGSVNTTTTGSTPVTTASTSSTGGNTNTTTTGSATTGATTGGSPNVTTTTGSSNATTTLTPAPTPAPTQPPSTTETSSASVVAVFAGLYALLVLSM